MLPEERSLEPVVNMGNIITLETSGDFKKTNKFLEAIKQRKIYDVLDEYGKKGVELLSANTPIRSSATANSWTYIKESSPNQISLEWHNTNLSNDGKTPVVILIIKGHGTRTGGYVAPNDFVSPIMEQLFKDAADAVWKVVKSL